MGGDGSCSTAGSKVEGHDYPTGSMAGGKYILRKKYGQKQGIYLLPLFKSPNNIKDMLHYKRMLKATPLFRLQITLLKTFLLKAFDPVPSPRPTVLHLALAKLLRDPPLFFDRTSQTPTTVTNPVTTDHKASLILGSDTKAAPICFGECPKAASCIWGGWYRERKNKAPLIQTPITPKPPLHAGSGTPQSKSFMWGAVKRRQQTGILPPAPGDASTSLTTAFFC